MVENAVTEEARQILPEAREDELLHAIHTRNIEAPYFNLRNILRMAIRAGYEARTAEILAKIDALPRGAGDDEIAGCLLDIARMLDPQRAWTVWDEYIQQIDNERGSQI